MKLLYDDKHDGYRSKRYIAWVKETEDLVTECHLYVTEYDDGRVDKHRKTFKSQKFLCINGPLEGKKITEEEGDKKGYVRYNCSGDPKAPSGILVKFK